MKHLTDDQLEKSIENVRNRELETLSEMLKHLREVDRRKLFSKRGYTSLYDYAMKKLKYSGDQANRRISAMRLLRDVPEIESKIADGSLKLTHLTDANTLFRKVEHTRDEKLQILTRLENCTKTEARKVLKQEEQKARFSFEADSELEGAVERLRGLHPHLTFDDLMKKVCLMAVERLDPAAKARRIADKPITSTRAARVKRCENLANSTAAPKPTSKFTRYISVPTKREVWLRAEGKCELCHSTFALEFDHIKSFALGGTHELSNLRLLCRNCNHRKGIEAFGLAKMSRYPLSAARL